MEEMIGKRYEIYIGLKDKDSYEEIFDPYFFSQVLAKVCSDHKFGFSLTTQLGGYSHNKGYVTETSLRITLIGLEKEKVYLLGDKLKELINTDTIMITGEDIYYNFL